MAAKTGYQKLSSHSNPSSTGKRSTAKKESEAYKNGDQIWSFNLSGYNIVRSPLCYEGSWLGIFATDCSHVGDSNRPESVVVEVEVGVCVGSGFGVGLNYLPWRRTWQILCYKTIFATSQAVHLFLSRLTDGTVKTFFLTTLCHDWDSNSRQQACTTLWDLNSGPVYQLSYRDRCH